MNRTNPPRIAYDDAGTGGVTVLLLPGWCSNRTVFRDLVPILSSTDRVLALDWRGHGDSDPVEQDFGAAALVDDALAVIDAAGAGPVVPVALAHAGWVAIELRRRLGADRVPGLVLLDWMVLGPPPPFLDALAGLQDPDAWTDVRAALFAMWSTGVDLPALDANLAEMGAYGQDMWNRAGREIAASFRAEGSPVAALEALDPPSPTLHVYAQPAADEALEAQQAYAREHPWFQVQRLDARSHFPMFEVPGELSAAITGFAHSLPSVVTA